MKLSILEIKNWWKKNEVDFMLGIGVFLFVLTAFFAGRISVFSETKESLVIEVPDSVLQKQAEIAEQGSLVRLAQPDSGESSIVNRKSPGIPPEERRGEYVASKNGAYYYTADMYMATRISIKNRVWFDSRAEAERRGLKPARGL